MNASSLVLKMVLYVNEMDEVTKAEEIVEAKEQGTNRD